MASKLFGLALALAGFAGSAALPQQAAAQAYPTKSINLIVPFGAGGGTDVVARTIAEDLSKALGQSLIVEARPGANGAIGSGVVAKAPADGYTLLFTAQSTYSLNPNLMKELPYDQINDFVPISTIGRSPWMLVVPAKSPHKTVADLIAWGKANPGKLSFGFWQSSVLVTGTAFEQAAGIQMRKVPYKGAVEATTDLLAERLDVMFTDTNGARPGVEGGTMRILGMATAKRSSLFPNTPTLAEQGIPLVSDSMLAVFAPAKTPKPIVEKLNAEINKIVATSQPVRDRLASVGLEPATMTVAEADAFVRSELTRWGDMITKAGLKKE
jgi:tripartite-type tricarboxylate transporter receptor subunit TctC